MVLAEPEWIAWSGADGTRLMGQLHGKKPHPRMPVICLPGLTRNSQDFDVIARALAFDPAIPRPVLAVDYRGRGRSSFADPESYRPDVELADVIAGLDKLGWRRVAVIGTSRGGLIAMLFAALHPERLGPVILNDIGPVLPLEGLSALRDRLADMQAHKPASWEEVENLLQRLMGDAFPALHEEDWISLARRLYREDKGQIRLDYDPALIRTFENLNSEAAPPSFWPSFQRLAERPLLVVRGENSDLLQEKHLKDMQDQAPHMQVHRVPGEGHAPLLDDAPTIARIKRFLNEAEGSHSA